MILDDGGDATMYILLGARAEAGEDVLSNPDSEEEEVLFAQIKQAHGGDARLLHAPARSHQGA